MCPPTFQCVRCSRAKGHVRHGRVSSVSYVSHRGSVCFAGRVTIAAASQPAPASGGCSFGADGAASDESAGCSLRLTWQSVPQYWVRLHREQRCSAPLLPQPSRAQSWFSSAAAAASSTGTVGPAPPSAGADGRGGGFGRGIQLAAPATTRAASESVAAQSAHGELSMACSQVYAWKWGGVCSGCKACRHGEPCRSRMYARARKRGRGRV